MKGLLDSSEEYGMVSLGRFLFGTVFWEVVGRLVCSCGYLMGVVWVSAVRFSCYMPAATLWSSSKNTKRFFSTVMWLAINMAV